MNYLSNVLLYKAPKYYQYLNSSSSINFKFNISFKHNAYVFLFTTVRSQQQRIRAALCSKYNKVRLTAPCAGGAAHLTATGKLANNASLFNAVSYEFPLLSTTDQLPRLLTDAMQHILTFHAIITKVANFYSKNIKFNIKFAFTTIRNTHERYIIMQQKLLVE